MPHSLPTLKDRVRIAAWLSPPKLPKLLSAAIIFFTSSQLGLHFWPSSALVYGIRADYLAPTLYFLDLVIIWYLWLLRPKAPPWMGPLLATLLINLLYSASPLASLAWSLHLFLYLSFVGTLTRRTVMITLLLAAMILQVALAGAQVFLGKSLGGIFYYLGERMVAVGSPNIALSSFLGSTVLRAYGTFSHPNVLAGWLVVGTLIVLAQQSRRKYQLLATALAAAGVFLTQSRAAALALFGLVIPFYLIKNIKNRVIYFGTLFLCFFVSFPHLTPARADLSQAERHELWTISTKVIKQTPLFGVGTQASVATYPMIAPNFRLLQPDHNSFTLFLSWFGIGGVLAILYVLRPFIAYRWHLLIPLLPLLLLDHYFLTSPQGLFIALLYVRFAD